MELCFLAPLVEETGVLNIPIALLIALLLLILNAFFVLAEFALVKIRPSRVEELSDQEHPRANLVQHIQNNIDEYLSVCQVGITFASIGLGFVGEPAFARLLEIKLGLGTFISHGFAVAVAYIIVSFLHITLAELVPKSLAIRKAEIMALRTARPLKFFRTIFYLPLVVLNGSANLFLAMFGVSSGVGESSHSQDELKILLVRSQSLGMMSFRRLLLMENIFDLGDLKVRDAMRPRAFAKTLSTEHSWEENLKIIRDSRLSRYPLIHDSEEKPYGIIHVKDLLYEGPEQMANVDLTKIARPYSTVEEDSSLETLLADLQRRRGHMVVVLGKNGKWTGFITFEDVIEEIIGTIEDEFEVEPSLFLADALSVGRILLNIKATSMEMAIRQVLSKLPQKELPIPADKVTEAVLERERVMPTYLGRGVALPHARLEGLTKPVLIFARSPEGIPVLGRTDKAHLMFLLLTPAGAPRIQARLFARIGGLMDSEFVEERLLEAESAQAVLEAIKAGDPVALS